MSNKLAVIKRQIQAPAVLEKFNEVNELGLDFKREVGFALQHLGKNTYLQGADQNSILTAVYNVALTGLSLSPVLAQAYLVPRKVKGVLLCSLDISYQGLISKLIDTGQATDVYAHVVYKGDEFEYDMSRNKVVKHQPYWLVGKEKGVEIAAYAVAVLPNGDLKAEVKPMAYVNSVADASESVKSDKKNNTKYSPWNGAFREEMIKKTMVKQLWKYMPKNQKAEAVANVLNVDNETNHIDFTASEIVDTPTGEAKVTTKNTEGTNTAIENTLKKVESKIPAAEEAEVVTEEPTTHKMSPNTEEFEKDLKKSEEEVPAVSKVEEKKVTPEEEPDKEGPLEEIEAPTAEEVVVEDEDKGLTWDPTWKVYSEKGLMNLGDAKAVHEIIVKRGLENMVPEEGKNTNMKYRKVVLKHQEMCKPLIDQVVVPEVTNEPINIDTKATEEKVNVAKEVTTAIIEEVSEIMSVLGVEDASTENPRNFPEMRDIWDLLGEDGDCEISEANAGEIISNLEFPYKNKEDLCQHCSVQHLGMFISVVLSR